MIEYALIAVMHLYGDKLGPEILLDYYPTQQECIEVAANAQYIVDEIELQWYYFMEEERSNGNMVPRIKSIGMFCKPLEEIDGDEV